MHISAISWHVSYKKEHLVSTLRRREIRHLWQVIMSFRRSHRCYSAEYDRRSINQHSYCLWTIIKCLLIYRAFSSRNMSFICLLINVLYYELHSHLLYRPGEPNTRRLFTRVFMCAFQGGSKRYFSHLLELLFFFFFRLSFLAFIQIWNMMSFGRTESLLQLKRKNRFHI